MGVEKIAAYQMYFIRYLSNVTYLITLTIGVVVRGLLAKGRTWDSNNLFSN